MADAIKAKFDIAAELIKGGGGIFDVKVDGQLIYCKKETGRFPEHSEVLDGIGKLQAAK
ncbi:MAG: Rdx family protein [Planctomycetes bacterium]|nr:Rdx family protein [Planctomycetota bacterium]MCH8970390.1 Rdx family protein [Planctomycetota bacterium]